MVNAKLLEWAVSAMLGWTVPAGEQDASRARYEAIAKDAIEVAYDQAERPIFGGEEGRLKTLSLMLAIASMESGFEAAVDSGEKRGDSGSSWCFMQIHLPGDSRITLSKDFYGYAGKGWNGRDLVNDRKKCFRAGLHIARESFTICRNLSVYSSGKCRRDDSEPKARHRVARARELWAKETPGRDSEFLAFAD